MRRSGVRASAIPPCRAVALCIVPRRAVTMVPDGILKVLLAVVQAGACRFGSGVTWRGSSCAVLSTAAHTLMTTDIECSMLPSARFAAQVVRSSIHGSIAASACRFSISGASLWAVSSVGSSGVWFWLGSCRCRWDCCREIRFWSWFLSSLVFSERSAWFLDSSCAFWCQMRRSTR